VDRSEYDKLDRVEDRMWWFAALHRNLLMLARRLPLDADLPILDAGCGTGGFLARLTGGYRERTLVGLDFDLQASTRAAVKSAQPVCAGSVNDLPFADGVLAAIFSADVLCHEGVDEYRVLRQFHRCLAENGWLILNLPAYRWMLSRHDVAVRNVRRYTATGLRGLLRSAGFHPVYMSYWNAMLFPIMAEAV
jgi:SAM-dependent methyltransferase